MKKFLRSSALFVGLLMLPALAQAADTYTIDPMHTSVTWTINHFGFSNPWGKFTQITGSLILDDKSPQNSKVTVSIPTAALVTGIEKLDQHLKSKDFFDVATYPDATFVSSKVDIKGTNGSALNGEGTQAAVAGILTLHGVSMPVTLNVTLNKIGENMMKKKTAGFSATTTIKRSDFGMTTFLPGLGDEVKLYIESEANI